MTSVTITKKVAGHKAGDTLNTSPGAAQFLINAGYADALESDDKPKRGRPTKVEANTQ
jgi:hypothetical protein